MFRLRSILEVFSGPQQCRTYQFQPHLRVLPPPNTAPRTAFPRRYLHFEVTTWNPTKTDTEETISQDEVAPSLPPLSGEQRWLKRRQDIKYRRRERRIKMKLARARGRAPEAIKIDVPELLSKPTWSIRSLLPPAPEQVQSEVTAKQLHHLLRLSALPLPKDEVEEGKMLETLHQQLHFVREIQAVDTEGVEPLCSLKDESTEGIKEATIGLDTPEIKEALANEEVVGRMRRPRRRKENVKKVEKDWDVFGTAGETVEHAGGRYFVVRAGK